MCSMVDLSALFSSPSTPVIALCSRTNASSRKAQLKPRSIPERQHQVRLSEEEANALVVDYQSGLSIPQLVRKFAVHRTTALEHLERRGVARRPNPRKLTDQDVQRASYMYVNGASLVYVGEVFDVNESTIRRELIRAGVRIRPRKGCNELRATPDSND